MSGSSKYLTKSKFKAGHECANKLYFTQTPEYPSQKEDNPFLKALAEGGFQVGELAKLRIPGGVTVETMEKTKAIAETGDLLKRDSAVVYEAAFQFEGTFVRTDIVERIGSTIRLTEVKSKTYDPDKIRDQGFSTKNGISSDWKPYLMDIAFQVFVIKKAMPGYTVTANIMLANKEAVATVDGLNQMFLIQPNSSGASKVLVKQGTNVNTIGEPLLESFNVDDIVGSILSGTYSGKTFDEYVKSLSEIYASGSFPGVPVTRHCKDCEFRIKEEMKSGGGKSGFEKCFTEIAKVKPRDLSKPFVFDVRNNWRVADDIMPKGVLFADELTEDDIKPKKDKEKAGWSQSERRMIQVEFAKNANLGVKVLKDELAAEVATWKYPLHFIDFETARVAIPFNKGRRPYEQIAFQFSHHVVSREGQISHKTQYLSVDQGKFPNFDFVRNLMAALSEDDGSIFRYHNHENTVLNDIRRQILAAPRSQPDSETLLTFIDSITTRKADKHVGSRSMIDLCEVVERFYFHPLMGGRTSIKKVLPAILADSKYLQSKYSRPIFDLNISSLARGNFTLIQLDESDRVVDPYHALPPVFDDLDIQTSCDEDGIEIDGEIHEGGAAMMAYARMQFSDMTQKQRRQSEQALLRYCELDTMAMVLIWDYFVNDILKLD